MPSKRTKKATKPKKAKSKVETRMSQVQTTRVNVRVAGGPGGPGGAGGGGGSGRRGGFLSVPMGLGITYTPPSPPMEYGPQVPNTPYMASTFAPAPVKREPHGDFFTGVSHICSRPTRSQSHSDMGVKAFADYHSVKLERGRLGSASLVGAARGRGKRGMAGELRERGMQG